MNTKSKIMHVFHWKRLRRKPTFHTDQLEKTVCKAYNENKRIGITKVASMFVRSVVGQSRMPHWFKMEQI